MTSNLLQGVPKLSRWTLTVTCTEKFLDIVHFGFNYYTVVEFFSKHFGDERKETLRDKILYCYKMYHNKDTGTFSVLLCRFLTYGIKAP